LWFRHLRSIRRHISRYAPVDAPWRRTHIRRHIVELFISMTLTFGMWSWMFTKLGGKWWIQQAIDNGVTKEEIM
ncbi:MAG: hypothetical protein WBM78_20575, partial [Desulfobacterales bacterium]